MEYKLYDPVKLTPDENAIDIIDQRELPSAVKHITLHNAEEIARAIKTLAVRGAPCLGVCAAYGVYICARSHQNESDSVFRQKLSDDCNIISQARPTAVNLKWAVDQMMTSVLNEPNVRNIKDVVELLKAKAEEFHQKDIEICSAVSEYGLELIKDGSTVITHCNAGGLATSRYGTGLGSLILGAEKGMHFHAFVDETRPLLQGARLTAWELMQAGVETTLICDNMAAYMMSCRNIDAVMVGCDRVAANGDTANKIGTLGLAVAAKHFGVPFYVFCPLSTIDVSCLTGNDINIELRESTEITSLNFERPIAPDGIDVMNPAFDVTPAELITAIITENGIFYPPYDFTDISNNIF